jgi:hypothetical protein
MKKTASRRIVMAIAEPYPRRRKPKASRHMYVLSTSVDPKGPPCVMVQTMSKVRRESMTVTAITTVVEAVSAGKVTWRKVCSAEAPSTLAASRIWVSTPLSPARYRSMT